MTHSLLQNVGRRSGDWALVCGCGDQCAKPLELYARTGDFGSDVGLDGDVAVVTIGGEIPDLALPVDYAALGHTFWASVRVGAGLFEVHVLYESAHRGVTVRVGHLAGEKGIARIPVDAERRVVHCPN